MNVMMALKSVMFARIAMSAVLLAVISRRGLLRSMWPLAALIATISLSTSVDLPMMFFRKYTGLSKMGAYQMIFWTTWTCTVAEAVLSVVVVYRIFHIVLQPFEPLRDIGKGIFRWIAAISLAVAIAVAIGPHMFGIRYATALFSQLEQFVNVVTLCLLLFVCFALRPLGLSFRSRYFGACLGLGLMATAELVLTAWFAADAQHSLYSVLYVWSGVAYCVTLSIWTAYFTLPEPASRRILLPTTSPFFLWNKISFALDDQPGYVAVSGFGPEDLAPAEIEALKAFTDDPEYRAPRMVNHLPSYFGS